MNTTRHYLVTIHDVGNITDRAENIHTILTSTDNIQPRERVEVVEHDAAERTFDAKVSQYVADPGFDGTVRQYLATMAEDYAEQCTAYPNDQIWEAFTRAKRDAYRDALRVLDDAIDAAARYTCEHCGNAIAQSIDPIGAGREWAEVDSWGDDRDFQCGLSDGGQHTPGTGSA